MRRLIMIAGGAAVLLAAGYFGWSSRGLLSTAPPPGAPPGEVASEGRAPRYLLNVILHTPEEIGGLLTRAEELARTRPPAGTDVGIALVLHGPEVEFFARRQYPRFKALVDQAQRLDAARIIEFKICQTEMKSHGLKPEDIPDFIQPVPYGPDEIERLQRRGYVYL